MLYIIDKKRHGDISRIHDENAANALNIPKGQNDPLRKGDTAKILADEYKVSPKTIKRDKKLAEGINVIGEYSTDARQKVLSGEIPINKNTLYDLASSPPNVIKTIINEIETGEYKRNPPRSNTQADSTNLISIWDETSVEEIRKLSSIVSGFAKNLNSMVQSPGDDDPKEIRTAVRALIDNLEEWYKQSSS